MHPFLLLLIKRMIQTIHSGDDYAIIIRRITRNFKNRTVCADCGLIPRERSNLFA